MHALGHSLEANLESERRPRLGHDGVIDGILYAQFMDALGEKLFAHYGTVRSVTSGKEEHPWKLDTHVYETTQARDP